MKYTSILLTAFAALAMAQNDNGSDESYAVGLEDFLEECFTASDTFEDFAQCYNDEEGEDDKLKEPIAHAVEDALEKCLQGPAEGEKATLKSFGECYTDVALNREYTDEQMDKELYALGLEFYIVDCISESDDSYDKLKSCYNDFVQEEDTDSPEDE